ncbi:glycogen/starch/alpha-glucan phosphorylase, partial [Acinetobacter baumannii]|nr:glycogen/starch/alpha-glucan phosphorylase [Acinetobacter baumannii]
LVCESIGDGWIGDLDKLRELEPHADDTGFRDRWQAARRENKEDLARLVRETTGVVVDPASMFDVMVKRIHEYKRQHLAVLHIVALYHRIKS